MTQSDIQTWWREHKCIQKYTEIDFFQEVHCMKYKMLKAFTKLNIQVQYCN